MLATPLSTPSNAPLPRGVRRALEAMRADLAHDWDVGQLAAAAGLSSRTLQRQFQLFLGKAAGTALRDLRFERTRRELLQGPPDVKIMDVALRCGFSHLGRFSVEYRRRYGETPSETVKRQGLLSDALAAMPACLGPSRDRPTIAVGPIEAPPEHAELGRSLTDELATALTRAGIAVVSRPGAARYHLTGILRRQSAHSRLTFRLVERETGLHLWAHQSDSGTQDDGFCDEQLAARIAAAIQPSLRLAEIETAKRKPDRELSPYDLTLRAMPGVLAIDAEGNARALDLLERAIAGDPDQPLATALASWAHAQRVAYHFAATPREDRASGMELARKTLARTADATVLAVLGNALTLLHDLDTAEIAIRKALAVDGGSAWAWSRSGWIGVYKGDAESAIERFKIALDLAPHDTLAFNSLVGIGVAHLTAGRYLDAARWQQRGLLEHPSAIWVHRTMCPGYVLGGAEAEARRSITALRAEYPELTIRDVQQGLPPLMPNVRELVLDGLQSAGLPA